MARKLWRWTKRKWAACFASVVTLAKHLVDRRKSVVVVGSTGKRAAWGSWGGAERDCHVQHGI
jgi:hypothetical protein